jgi:hypothetical protein
MIASIRAMPCPINTSTYRNFVIISSGLGRFFAILGPPFLEHSAGPVQMGRLKMVLKNGARHRDGGILTTVDVMVSSQIMR